MALPVLYQCHLVEIVSVVFVFVFAFLPSQVSEKVGNVIEVMPNGDVYVFFEDVEKAYVFNPAALRLQVPEVKETSHHGIQSALESTTRGKILSHPQLRGSSLCVKHI